ncbi:hypothetical protein JNW88_01770 [Micromonospora sp. ATA32]|nr:hypothetical protein [Micromonospora sp. ATA32]
MAESSGPTPGVILQLVRAGVLVSGKAPTDERWDPVRRFHEWANHEIYLDGSDPTGASRKAAVAQFSADDIDTMRNPDAEGGSEAVLAADLAEVVWAASLRMRANRVRVSEATDARGLLFSYGAAHDLIVVDQYSHRAPVAWVDLGRFGYGRPLAADPATLLRDVGSRGIAVVGRFERYQRRYRHEKAMRGFLIDGGRVLGEVARAVATRYGSAMVSDTPLPPGKAELDPSEILVVGIVAVR